MKSKMITMLILSVLTELGSSLCNLGSSLNSTKRKLWFRQSKNQEVNRITKNSSKIMQTRKQQRASSGRHRSR
jgi:hypothetical protein